MLEINRDPSRADLRWFGLVLFLFFIVLGSLARWRFGAATAGTGLWIAGGALCAIYYAVTPLRRWMFVGWMLAAYPIGWTVSHALLLVVYYLILTPIGIGLRLAGHDPLQKRFDRASPSYWTRREPPGELSRYFRQF